MLQALRAVTVAVVMAFFPLAAGAADTDKAAVQRIISEQLAAFDADDAAGAFAFAAPQIKRMFGTPDRFIQMVKQGYRPVYDANAPTFLRSAPIGDAQYVQEVGLVDDQGQSWTAIYSLVKLTDGEWRISGCVLRPADGQSI